MIIKMATGGSDRDFNSDCNENKYFDKDQIHSDRSPTNDAENENKKPEMSKAEDNPFSFKRFLQASNGNLINGHHRPPSNRLSNLDLAHDLPDFVQDHYNTSETEARSSKLPHESDLPDFARDMTSTMDGRPAPSMGARPKTFSRNIQPVEEVETQSSMSFTNFISREVVDNCVKSLPDFLSDSGVGPSHARDSTSNDCAASLKARNTFLMKKLEELNQAYQLERERGRKLSSQLQEVHKYEKDDIHTLEKMVQQAEANLVSTNRQLKTEKEININLQQQLLSMNNKMEMLKNQAVCMKCGNKFVDGRVETASHQIAVAAIEAEKLLKQLLVGVDNLKAVSNLLASCNMSDLTNSCSE